MNPRANDHKGRDLFCGHGLNLEMAPGTSRPCRSALCARSGGRNPESHLSAALVRVVDGTWPSGRGESSRAWDRNRSTYAANSPGTAQRCANSRRSAPIVLPSSALPRPSALNSAMAATNDRWTRAVGGLNSGIATLVSSRPHLRTLDVRDDDSPARGGLARGRGLKALSRGDSVAYRPLRERTAQMCRRTWPVVCRVGDWAQAWVVGWRCSPLMRDIGWLGDRPRTMRAGSRLRATPTRPDP